jgi:hypothetical protein
VAVAVPGQGADTVTILHSQRGQGAVPSTRRETISCSPWWRSACTSSEEISSGCCIIKPFMSGPFFPA